MLRAECVLCEINVCWGEKNKRKERHKNFRIYLFSASLGTKWCPGRAGAWLEDAEDNSGAMQGESRELQEEHWGGTSSLILSCIYFLNLLVCSLSLDPVLWYLCRFIVNISPQGSIEEISLDCTRKKKKDKNKNQRQSLFRAIVTGTPWQHLKLIITKRWI